MGRWSSYRGGHIAGFTVLDFFTSTKDDVLFNPIAFCLFVQLMFLETRSVVLDL